MYDAQQDWLTFVSIQDLRTRTGGTSSGMRRFYTSFVAIMPIRTAPRCRRSSGPSTYRVHRPERLPVLRVSKAGRSLYRRS